MSDPLPWLDDEDLSFPDPASALHDPNGLLAAGGDLSPERLLAAYQRGIFPWFEEDQPPLWWSPDPRMVLFPDELHISRSMGRFLRKHDYRISSDTAFTAVMQGCAAPRKDSQGTWISPQMLSAYKRLHTMGVAHSVEVWEQEKLVGGLYGLAMGRVFFGESMFSIRPNVSKLALIDLVNRLKRAGFTLIDCQVANPHLESLGARRIPRSAFMQHLPVSSALSETSDIGIASSWPYNSNSISNSETK